MSGFAHLGPARDVEALKAFPRVVLFGAGGAAGEVEAWLARAGCAVVAYADNAPAKHGTEFRGRPVWAPVALAARLGPREAVVIASAYQAEIAAQCTGPLGLPPARVFPFVSQMFEGHYGAAPFAGAGEEIAWLRDRLADDPSRAYLDALLATRWTMDARHLARNPRLRGFYDYDAPGLGPHPHDLIIDCGAYTGDTALVYLKRLGGEARVIALEPNPANFARLVATVMAEGLAGRVTPLPLAAGRGPGTARIAADGAHADPRARLTEAGHAVAVAALDDLLRQGPRPGFLKIDVEGHEPDLLEGARGLLAAHRPGLALALYHAPDHLWRLPRLVDAIAPGYRMYLGHHPANPFECELFASPRDA